MLTVNNAVRFLVAGTVAAATAGIALGAQGRAALGGGRGPAGDLSRAITRTARYSSASGTSGDRMKSLKRNHSDTSGSCS